jgi:hypothetical protein
MVSAASVGQCREEKDREEAMRIEITQEDIDKGRMNVKETCGCPIWQAVVRQLQIPESQAKDLVRLPCYETVRLGNTKFRLPKEAVSFQRILVEYPLAHIEPCVFDAPVAEYSDPKEPKSEEAQPAEAQQEKPTLFERVFGK